MENKKEFECGTKVEVRKAEFLAADEACKAMEALGLQQRGALIISTPLRVENSEMFISQGL